MIKVIYFIRLLMLLLINRYSNLVAVFSNTTLVISKGESAERELKTLVTATTHEDHNQGTTQQSLAKRKRTDLYTARDLMKMR